MRRGEGRPRGARNQEAPRFPTTPRNPATPPPAPATPPRADALSPTTRQSRCDPADVAEIAHRADAEFADRVAAEDGFVAYEMIDAGDGRIVTLTVFADRDGAERSTALAADFVRDSLEGLTIE